MEKDLLETFVTLANVQILVKPRRFCTYPKLRSAIV